MEKEGLCKSTDGYSMHHFKFSEFSLGLIEQLFNPIDTSFLIEVRDREQLCNIGEVHRPCISRRAIAQTILSEHSDSLVIISTENQIAREVNNQFPFIRKVNLLA